MSGGVSFCCEDMKQDIENNGAIHYSDVFDEYGINISEDDVSYVLIHYCPWCGEALPPSKRLEWFEQLEELGFENPLFRDDIPIAYRSGEWRTQHNDN